MQAFNDNLIEAIRERIPKKGDQLLFLMSTLSMGKETAYRRLRGDIPFTFAEACCIAQQLRISLDKIAKVNKLDKPTFELEISPSDVNDYVKYKLNQYEESYSFFESAPNLIIESVCNVVPYSFLFEYENLFHLYSFRLLYQAGLRGNTIRFSDRRLTDELQEKRMKLIALSNHLPENTVIFDRNIFTSFIKHIQYFYSIGLISEEEKEVLKEELTQLIDDFENMAIIGRSRSGNENAAKSWFYLSNIDFDCNYSYVKGDNFERAYMDGIYLMDTISSSDPHICKLHKGWIESLKKYSTLISVSGEMERRSFFEKQRQVVREI